MNRIEAEDYVYQSYRKAQNYQEYHRKDSQKRRPDLTKQMLRKLSKTPCTVVTGSKGKGSVASMISQILQTKYVVGLMTSPHISNFCERFRVNGQMISDRELVSHISTLKPEFDQIDSRLSREVCISPMGIQAALALSFFNQKETEFNVFECGKGARYDDVTNVRHQYAVINRIFMEHTRELGGTLAEIAEDKSYVITGEQSCVYVARQEPEVMEVLKKRSEDCGVLLKCYASDFEAVNIRFTDTGMCFDVVVGEHNYRNIRIPLMGEHQAENCALAFALCQDVLGEIDEERIKQNLERMRWPGRMEILQSDPVILLDACINSSSCKNVKDVLKHLGILKAVVVLGIPDDKDFEGVAREMETIAWKMILTKSQNPHYKFSIKQKEALAEIGINVLWTESVAEAMERSTELGKPIVILGTTSVVAEVHSLYKLYK